MSAMRTILTRATTWFKQQEMVDERVRVLEAWKEKELTAPERDEAAVEAVLAKQPRKVKKRRFLYDNPDAPEEERILLGEQEYIDYVFPEDEKGKGVLKLLERAQQWKAQAKLGDDVGVKRPRE